MNSNMSLTDAFTELRIDANTTQEAPKSAYRELVKQLHRTSIRTSPG
jgi:hypothetical protein